MVVGLPVCPYAMGYEHTSQRVTRQGPSRTAVGACALVLLALAVFFPVVLVRNWSDNAYLLFPIVGIALFLLSLPFAVAAAIPAMPVRRIVARIGVILVRVVGGLCCVLLCFALVPAATQYSTYAVFISHLAGLALLLPVVIGIGWRFDRGSRA
jgi:hypothetical protein